MAALDRRMRRAGEILFIGERRQLVFHVVPHPSKLGHFTDVYARALGAPAAAASTHVVAFGTQRASRAGRPAPQVTAEVVAVRPAAEFADEWWAADHAHGDLTVQVTAEATPVSKAPDPAPVPVRPLSRAMPLALFAGLMTTTAVASRTASRRTSTALRLQS